MPLSKIRIDFIVILGIVFAAIPISFLIGANFLTSTIFFFGAPSIYLFFRQKNQWRRIFSAALLFGILYGFLLDYLAEFNNAWSWAGTEQLVFQYKILGVVSIDVMIWFFLWVFFLVIFYEHFLEHERGDRISKNFKYAMYPGFMILAGLIVINVINPELLKFDYAYFVLGILTLPPFIYVISKKPVLLLKFLKTSLFFVLFYFVYEVTALHLDQWHFTGQYVGMVKFGNIIFPFEEFIIWILMSSPIVLSYYELYVDDFK